MKHVED